MFKKRKKRKSLVPSAEELLTRAEIEYPNASRSEIFKEAKKYTDEYYKEYKIEEIEKQIKTQKIMATLQLFVVLMLLFLIPFGLLNGFTFVSGLNIFLLLWNMFMAHKNIKGARKNQINLTKTYLI